MPSSEWPDEKAIAAATRAIYERTRGAAIPGVLLGGARTSHVGTGTLAVDALLAAAKASPVIPAPKCETCGGRWTRCPRCHGTGVAEVIPVAVHALIDAVLEEVARSNPSDTLYAKANELAKAVGYAG